MPSGNTCQRVVGRLIEIRLEGYRSPEEVDATNATLKGLLDPMPPHERVIIAADWRRCTLLGLATIERARVMLSGVNPRTLRSALLARG